MQSSLRVASPLASSSNSPTTSQSQSPQPGLTSPMGKSFPKVLVSEESSHESSVIDVTSIEAPNTNETANESSETDSMKSSRNSTKSCPCGKSSGGKSWFLKCIGCGQAWHNTCSNLKGRYQNQLLATWIAGFVPGVLCAHKNHQRVKKG